MSFDWDIFLCEDCGVNTADINEYYMVHDSIWVLEAHQPLWGGGMLCIDCLEKRIGRKLTLKDFTDAPINQLDSYKKSVRYLDRLGVNMRCPNCSNNFVWKAVEGERVLYCQKCDAEYILEGGKAVAKCGGKSKKSGKKGKK